LTLALSRLDTASRGCRATALYAVWRRRAWRLGPVG